MGRRSNPSIVRVDYQDFTKRQARELKARCIAEIGWSPMSFYNKMNGTQPITPKEYEKLWTIITDVTNSKRATGSHVLATGA